MREHPRLLTPEEAQRRLLPLLETGALVPIVVTGSSMVPFLRGQLDRVYLRAPKDLPPRRGDIVFFQRPGGEFVLHRLDSVRPDGRLRINGDAQTWFEVIESGQVLGVVEGICRGGGAPFSPRRVDQRALWRVWRWLLPLRPKVLGLLAKRHR